MYAALQWGTPVMKVLLASKADPNEQSRAGATALSWAAGDPEKVRLLAEAGASYAGNLEAVRFLLAKGADPKLVDQNGDGPVGTAAQVRAIDPTQPVSDIQPIRDAVSADLARPRFTMWLLVGFAPAALLLAAIGLYGVMLPPGSYRRISSRSDARPACSRGAHGGARHARTQCRLCLG